MKIIKVYNKNNELISDGNTYEDPTDFLEYNKSYNVWGLPERWVHAKELMENGDPNEPEHWMWHSEHYVEGDVLETELVIDEDTGDTQTMVLLKADYIIEIIDLETDYDYLLQQCIENRKREYPPITELADALIKKELGDDSKYIEYIGKCEAVKAKYAKPVKESL